MNDRIAGALQRYRKAIYQRDQHLSVQIFCRHKHRMLDMGFYFGTIVGSKKHGQQINI